MAEDTFNPVLAEYSDEEVSPPPQKRVIPTTSPEPRKTLKLPSAKDLLSTVSPPQFLSDILSSKPVPSKPTLSAKAVIQKPATVTPSATTAIEQYDYFAQDPEANLTLWKAPQEIPDGERPMDKRKLIKKVDTRRVAVLGLDSGREKYTKRKVNRWEVPPRKDF